ncbi:autotransporter assembly complex protein TamA [Prosthecomicrobium pneumaticum]|uniref:Translocation and assembly module TamA n=1 Tax=Prosthecomicrobium pneumaticum TaxID=81895 RepID=A0A7W9CV23_9HYPH|nr:autotransporter assembly complex family protein [Prosthecomicrobium pneumaticum]MBB5752224.1 translocation and assembly module TamA [Prosthecomicrobium pneumaticum]
MVPQPAGRRRATGGGVVLGALLLASVSTLPAPAQEMGFFERVGVFLGLRDAPVPAIADALPYTVELTVEGAGRSTRKEIERSSRLQRLRRAPPSGSAGLLRRALGDIDLITAALYAHGRYAGTIRITVAGVPVDADGALAAIEAARSAGPVPVAVTVAAGPEFRFGSIALVDARGRPLVEPPTLAAIRLEPGEPARSAAVIDAEGRIARHYRDLGHPFAKVASKDVVADHARNTLDVTFFVDPGPVATFGAVTVSGEEQVRKGFVAERVRIVPGEMFSPKRLADTRKSIARYEIFSGVRIVEGDALDAQGRLPVEIVVTERKPRYVGFGAKYSSTDGSSINAFWGHRNLFGGAETLRLDGQLSWYGKTPDDVPDADPFGYRFTARFGKPGIFTPIDDLVTEASVLREVTDAYVREGYTVTAGVRRAFTEQLSGQIGLDFEDATVEDGDGSRDDLILGVPLDVAYDTTDNALDPSEGIRASATFEPFAQLGAAGAGPLLFRGALSAYRAFDEEKRTIIAGRVSAGTIFGADLLDVPPQRRFFVGGGGTVRGIDYQSASPRDADGDIIGGLSFFAASAEIRYRITEKIGIVPFVDVGAAFADSLPDFQDLRYSAGLGLRYYTGIGPLRFDVAVPLNPHSEDSGYGVYLSLGQAF